MYVYAEYLIIENFIINYIILYATKRFTRTKTSILRLIIAATMGAFYTLVVFFPSLIFMAKFTIKMSVSILMIIVAFNPVKIRKFIKLIATFYTVSFVFAGAALAMFYLSDEAIITGRGIFYIKDFSVKILVIAILVSLILAKTAWGYIQTKMKRSSKIVPIIINFNNKIVRTIALLDTGNSLKDPISKLPVIIVQFSIIKDLFPEETQKIFLRYEENNLEMITEIMYNTREKMKFRLIPFKSIGKENGMLLGFKPDNIILKEDDEEKIILDIIIGIYNSKLSDDEEYMALLHPEIFN